MPSLLHGSWKLLGELFGTGAHGSRCGNCRPWNYRTSNIKALSTRTIVESLIQESQYFVFFFVSLVMEKNADYVLNGGFKTGFFKWWCSIVTEVIITQWRSRVKIIGGARAPFFLFSPSPRYGIYIYIFWSLPNYWGGPGPQGPLMLLRPCYQEHLWQEHHCQNRDARSCPPYFMDHESY